MVWGHPDHKIMEIEIHKKTIIIFTIALLVVGLASYFLMYKNNGSEITNSYQTKSYQINNLYQKTLEKCPNKLLSCFDAHIKEITKEYGPTASLGVLKILQENGFIDKTVDDHQIAHSTGRETADIFGVNGAAFLSCPTSFNYGCQHGFFEAALVKVKPAKKAIDEICGSLGPEYSTKFKFYCYHGVGHGVLDSTAYDLKAALDICDTLDQRGADGCWQGVFMENVNAGMRDEAPKGIFSLIDPLAPCNKVEDKYRHECYINHAGWLMKFYSNDADRLDKAVQACLGAENYVNVCLQSLGLMATNPVWQSALIKNTHTNTEETAKEICLKFPKQYREQCIVAGVDNILNFDETNTSRAQTFCDIIEPDFQNACYRHIGLSLRSQVTDTNIILQKCSSFKEMYKRPCLSGAGL